MKQKLFSNGLLLCMMTVLVVMGVPTQAQNPTPYEGAPPTFMTLNATYAKFRYSSSSWSACNQSNELWKNNNADNPTNPGWYQTTASGTINNATTGIRTDANNWSHRLITTQSADQCMCYQIGNQVFRDSVLPQHGWAPDDPTQRIDTVMQVGGPHSQGKYSQSVEYWFRPSVDQSVLLVNFAFVQECVPHPTWRNPYFYIEVLDSAYNLLQLGYYSRLDNQPTNNPNQPYYWPYSRFLIVPYPKGNCETYYGPTTNYMPYCRATPSTYDYYGTGTFTTHICPSNYVPGSSYDAEWFQYTPIAFNLTKQAEQHRTVVFRVKAHGCQGIAHWAYGYFAAKMVPSYISVDACGDDAIALSVPAGFNADTYLWYAGADSISATQKTEYAGMRDIVLSRTDGTRIYPYYRCYMESMTGVPFIYEAHIKMYDLQPDFDFEQHYGTCDYRGQFTDNSQIILRAPAAEVGGSEDTTYQTTQWIQWFRKNQDGTTWTRFATNDLQPILNFDGPGTYEIKVVIEDADHICSDTIIKTITLSEDAIEQAFGKDTIYTCEENLPYIFDQATFGNDYTWHDAGTRRVTYPGANWNGCDSLVDVTLIVQKPRVDIAVGADFCDAFATTLSVYANVDVAAYKWNTDETSQMIEVTEPGTYSVTITDAGGCVAENQVVIPACKPFVNLPNTITPSDHNGLNDVFYIPQKNLIQSLEFMVFNRNGELVYQTKNKDFEWDGRVNGKLFVNTTYNYILKVVDYDNYATMYRGSILVL